MRVAVLLAIFGSCTVMMCAALSISQPHASHTSISFMQNSCRSIPPVQFIPRLHALSFRNVACKRSEDSSKLHSASDSQSSSGLAEFDQTRLGPISKRRKLMIEFAETVTTLFPVWTVLFALLGAVKPSLFSFFKTEYFTASLAVLMLSMGVTLTPDDFIRVSQEPEAVLLGSKLCYLLCPVLGIVLGKMFQIPVDQIAGMVLIGSLNGGQTSNLCTYIAKGDVPLSVLMTTFTTVASIFMTPLICKLLLGKVVPVNAVGIAKSCLQVILVPIGLGMLINKYFSRSVQKVLPLTPVVGMVATCLLVGSAVAQCSGAIASAGLKLQIPIMLFHLLSGIGGYYIPKMFNFTETQCRTMAIETSMKSSAFGFLLAKQHFKDFGARIPPAVSVVWVSLVGASLAVFWKYRPIKNVSAVASEVTEASAATA